MAWKMLNHADKGAVNGLEMMCEPMEIYAQKLCLRPSIRSQGPSIRSQARPEYRDKDPESCSNLDDKHHNDAVILGLVGLES